MQLRYKSLAMIIRKIKLHKNHKENLNYPWVKSQQKWESISSHMQLWLMCGTKTKQHKEETSSVTWISENIVWTHVRTQTLTGYNSLKLTHDKVSPFTKKILNLHNFIRCFIQCHTQAENRKGEEMAEWVSSSQNEKENIEKEAKMGHLYKREHPQT